jgi:bacillithiol system protein YtxJ
MKWIPLQHESQIEEINERSKERPQVIFKHSTRCGISSVAKNRLEKSTPPRDIDFYYLDLIKYRPISNKIAERYNVYHESPQVLVIKDGACIYDESHMGISMAEIEENLIVG